MAFSEEYKYRDCPWCGTQSISMKKMFGPQRVSTSTGANREWTYLTCPRCGGAVSIETTVNGTAIKQIVPDHKTEVDVEHLPADVHEYYRNALTVLKTGVPSAAAVELRRTLEAAAQHKGVDVRPLVQAITKLAEDGHITKDFVPVLSHIKKIGNQGAHAGDEPITEEEVRIAIKFTTQVLRNLFEIPKELEILNGGEVSSED